MIETPPNMPVKHRPILQPLGKWISRLQGWEITGEMANEKKLVLALAPHTSNWDFVLGLPIMLALNVNISVFMKREAFFWPFSNFLQGLGFVPINRQAADGIVESAAQQFHDHEEFWLLLTPEGTRKKVHRWKNGFLRIAEQADVPIQMIGVDYEEQRVHFGKVFRTSDDLQQDLERCIEYASQFKGRHPQN